MSVAAERIETLFDLAAAAVTADDPERARRYLRLAKRISERTRTPIPAHRKRQMCRGCDLRLIAGRTARVRVRPGRVVIRCTSCGQLHRYPFERPAD
jgi:ribonuclease P protein subunit Rpp21 (EC 3.1.26.5)